MNALSLQPHDQKAVDEADRRAHHEDREQARPPPAIRSRIPPCAAGITSMRADGGRDADRRFQRQVELARQHDQRFGEHDERERRRRAENADQVRLREKARADERADREQQHERGQQREIAKPREFDARRVARRRRRGGRAPAMRADSERYSSWRLTPSTDAISSWSCQPAGNSATMRAAEHHEDAVAGAQVVEFARDDQHRLALVAHAIDDREQRFLRFHVDAGGRVDQHEHLRIGRPARAPSRPSADCRPTGRTPAGPAPGVLMPSASIMRRPNAFFFAGDAMTEAPERARDRHRCVFRHRLRQHQPLAMPVLRHAADAVRERGGHVAGRQRRAIDADRAARCACKPAIASATLVRPLDVAPVSPTTSPRRTAKRHVLRKSSPASASTCSATGVSAASGARALHRRRRGRPARRSSPRSACRAATRRPAR